MTGEPDPNPYESPAADSKPRASADVFGCILQLASFSIGLAFVIPVFSLLLLILRPVPERESTLPIVARLQEFFAATLALGLAVIPVLFVAWLIQHVNRYRTFNLNQRIKRFFDEVERKD